MIFLMDLIDLITNEVPLANSILNTQESIWVFLAWRLSILYALNYRLWDTSDPLGRRLECYVGAV